MKFYQRVEVILLSCLLGLTTRANVQSDSAFVIDAGRYLQTPPTCAWSILTNHTTRPHEKIEDIVISGDGTTIVVESTNATQNGKTGVFRINDFGDPTLVANVYLVAGDAAEDFFSGSRVAVSDDGNTVAVSSPLATERETRVEKFVSSNTLAAGLRWDRI